MATIEECLYLRIDSSNRHVIITAHRRSLGQGNVFTPVCLFTWESLYDVTSCLAAWSYVPSKGISVSGPMFLVGGLPPERVGQTPSRTGKRVVRILLECFLVSRSIFFKIPRFFIVQVLFT